MLNTLFLHLPANISPQDIVPIFIGIAVFAIIIRLVAGSLDTGRIEDHFNQEGKQFISKEWTPLGKGWLGDSSDRIYRVQYKDMQGHIHEAYCKTSMWSGVYITEDKIIEYNKDAVSTEEQLLRENAELKEELSLLKEKLNK